MRVKNAVRFTGRERWVMVKALEDAAEYWHRLADSLRLYGGSGEAAKKLDTDGDAARALATKLEQYEETHSLLLVDEG